METEPALRFDGLGFRYRDGPWILRGCSGALRTGEVLAVLGPNGRGKSTLLRLLLGTLTPVEGLVARRGTAGFVPQSFDVAFGYSVLAMVLMGRARRVPLLGSPSRSDERAAFEALERFGLSASADRPFGDLSGGQRQLVMLARALAADASILLLDEPLAALDLANQKRVLDLIGDLAREGDKAVVFTTHHPGQALAASDRVLLMMAADRFVSGPTGDILTEPNLAEVYGVPMRRIRFEDEGRPMETLVPLSDARRA